MIHLPELEFSAITSRLPTTLQTYACGDEWQHGGPSCACPPLRKALTETVCPCLSFVDFGDRSPVSPRFSLLRTEETVRDDDIVLPHLRQPFDYSDRPLGRAALYSKNELICFFGSGFNSRGIDRFRVIFWYRLGSDTRGVSVRPVCWIRQGHPPVFSTAVQLKRVGGLRFGYRRDVSSAVHCSINAFKTPGGGGGGNTGSTCTRNQMPFRIQVSALTNISLERRRCRSAFVSYAYAQFGG